MQYAVRLILLILLGCRQSLGWMTLHMTGELQESLVSKEWFAACHRRHFQGA